jgi:hypothetical protein
MSLKTMGPIVDVVIPKPGENPYLKIRGMYGIGDCIFQRAVIRELMKTRTVVLETYYSDMYDDLVANGLKLNIVKDRGRIADSANRSLNQKGMPPISAYRADQLKVSYTPQEILRCGSILAAMYDSVKLRMPAQPDFSIPIKQEWINAWQSFLRERGIVTDKPIAVYRPICLNTAWTAPARAPDPIIYSTLFQTIKNKFFWVSIADLKDEKRTNKKEWIVGKHEKVDLHLEGGELDFKTLCGLFASSSMIYSNPGFVPVLAQALGTPVIVVYGANESFRTTNAVGKHLAKTLPIELDKPCEHHAQTCACLKTITVAPAKKKVLEFTESVLTKFESKPLIKPRVLIYGTMYNDTPERWQLVQLWARHHAKVNPGVRLLLIDSKSPLYSTDPIEADVWTFPDNIGHLSRNGLKGAKSSGRDGWGRAMCKGLEMAIEADYDYAVHIESDSLFKHPVMPIIERMKREELVFLSPPVKGTKSLETGWFETGLMFFDVKWARDFGFIKRYNWPGRQPSPTPERVIYSIINDNVEKKKWEFVNWGALRGDKQQINESNIGQLDWVTHVRNPVGMDDIPLYKKFSEASTAGTSPEVTAGTSASGGNAGRNAPTNIVKLNLGCGTNKLDGWVNHDADVNITRRLPWADRHADFIFAEHVVEHINLHQALAFFKECLRVLKPGGVLRITVPSLELIFENGNDPEYLEFLHSHKWAPTKDLRGAMHAILYCHGHQMAWTGDLLRYCLYYCGYGETVVTSPGKSSRKELVGVEGHGKVIGEKFNRIESVSVEAWKP